jgi:hypothetical protein
MRERDGRRLTGEFVLRLCYPELQLYKISTIRCMSWSFGLRANEVPRSPLGLRQLSGAPDIRARSDGSNHE